MQLRAFRFTLRQLITIIAVLALLLAALRTPFWPIFWGIGIILAGFAVDRTRGGPGIYGAMLAGVVGFAVFGCAVCIALYLLICWRPFNLPELLAMIFGSGVFGGAWGVVLGYWSWMIVNSFTRSARALPLTHEPLDQAATSHFEGHDREHAGNGGPPS